MKMFIILEALNETSFIYLGRLGFQRLILQMRNRRKVGRKWDGSGQLPAHGIFGWRWPSPTCLRDYYPLSFHFRNRRLLPTFFLFPSTSHEINLNGSVDTTDQYMYNHCNH